MKLESAQQEEELRRLIERAIKMAWRIGSEGGSESEITYEDVLSDADYD
jgi:hypothetical protein